MFGGLFCWVLVCVEVGKVVSCERIVGRFKCDSIRGLGE